jgi:hypothetical protein
LSIFLHPAQCSEQRLNQAEARHQPPLFLQRIRMDVDSRHTQITPAEAKAKSPSLLLPKQLDGPTTRYVQRRQACLKMKKQSRSITSLQLHNSALFLSTTHYFSGNSSDTQLSEVSVIQRLPSALRLPLKEIKKKSISYSSKERQVFASLIKSNSAVSVLAQPHCCNYATVAFIQKRKLCIGSLLPS